MEKTEKQNERKGPTFESDLNTVCLTGNLGKDAERRGDKVATVPLAVNATVDGKPRPTWIQMVAFGSMADVLVNNGLKGRKVAIEGKLQATTINAIVEVALDNGTKVSGLTKKTVTEVIIKKIFWMNGRPEEE